MNRYEVSYLGKPFMLYGVSESQVLQEYKDMIDKGSNIRLPEYPKSTFDKLTQCELVATKETEKEIHELRKVKTDVGNILFRIGKDKNDGRYFDLVTYRRTSGKLVMPCLKSVCNAAEFIERYCQYTPIKKSGFVISPKEIKKIAKKSLGKVQNHSIWRDSDGYVYFGYNADWGKRVKDFYNKFMPYKDTAVKIRYCSGLYGGYTIKWFTSMDEFNKFWIVECANTPYYAATPKYEVLAEKFCITPVEDRKLIGRLSYLNIERELAEGEQINIIARNWYQQNKHMFRCDETDFLEKVIKLIVDKSLVDNH